MPLQAFMLTLAVLAPALPNEAPAARAYMVWLDKALVELGQDMATFTAAAEAAVRPIVAGRNLGIRGDRGLASELHQRVGGFMFVDGQRGQAGDVILYVLGVRASGEDGSRALLQRQLDDAERLRRQGSVVIGIGSAAQLQALNMSKRATGALTVLLLNRAPAKDGMFKNEMGRWIVPTFGTANAAVAWTWSCELFSACTRAGKTLAVLPDLEGPRRDLAFKRDWSMRFHDRTIDPVKGGVLGRAYLKALRGVLRDVATASWTPLVDTAHHAAETILDGGKTYVRIGGQYLPHHYARQLACDPGFFVALDHDGNDPARPTPGSGDFVIAVGESQRPGSDAWGEPELLRNGSRGVSWIVSNYLVRKRDLRRTEILVDQHWPEGDALVRVPGYDTPIGPASGVVAESIFWSITAAVHSELAAYRRLVKSNR